MFEVTAYQILAITRRNIRWSSSHRILPMLLGLRRELAVLSATGLSPSGVRRLTASPSKTKRVETDKVFPLYALLGGQRWSGFLFLDIVNSDLGKPGIMLTGKTGFEPAASGVTDQHSNRLSYFPCPGVAGGGGFIKPPSLLFVL